MKMTPDVLVGERLREYLSALLPEFQIIRQYAEVREFLDEEELGEKKAFLVLEGLEERKDYGRTVRMDLRFTLGLYVPLLSVGEAELTAEMDSLMELNFRLADAFFEKILPQKDETAGRITLQEVLRTSGQMYDPELYRIYRLFANEYSLAVSYFREIERACPV